MKRSAFTFSIAGLLLAACSNLTAPPGENPDSLTAVNDGREDAPPRTIPLPHAKGDDRPAQPPDDATPALVRRILVAYDGAEGAKADLKRDRVEARKLAAEIAGKLKEGTADFGALAKEHSDAPDAAQGGMMPPFKRDADMDPTLKSAAFQTKVGEVSGVINTKQGFVILQRMK